VREMGVSRMATGAAESNRATRMEGVTGSLSSEVR
jgi:hypothetical protein